MADTITQIAANRIMNKIREALLPKLEEHMTKGYHGTVGVISTIQDGEVRHVKFVLEHTVRVG